MSDSGYYRPPNRTVTSSREEARLRLTCAALNGFRASEVDPGTKMMTADWVARLAVEDADACLALLYPEVPK